MLASRKSPWIWLMLTGGVRSGPTVWEICEICYRGIYRNGGIKTFLMVYVLYA